MGSEPESLTAPAAPRRRRPRDRARTETDLQEAVIRLIRRNGILGGISLQEVAEEAQVNRGQIYQLFDSRRGMVRAAITRLMQQLEHERSIFRSKPFAERRRLMFRQILGKPDVVGLWALLVLDGDHEVKVFPEFEATLQALAHDEEQGYLPKGSDGVALTVATASVYLGYCTFRDAIARDTGVPPEELDERVLEAFDLLLAGLSTSRT